MVIIDISILMMSSISILVLIISILDITSNGYNQYATTNNSILMAIISIFILMFIINILIVVFSIPIYSWL